MSLSNHAEVKRVPYAQILGEQLTKDQVVKLHKKFTRAVRENKESLEAPPVQLKLLISWVIDRKHENANDFALLRDFAPFMQAIIHLDKINQQTKIYETFLNFFKTTVVKELYKIFADPQAPKDYLTDEHSYESIIRFNKVIQWMDEMGAIFNPPVDVDRIQAGIASGDIHYSLDEIKQDNITNDQIAKFDMKLIYALNAFFEEQSDLRRCEHLRNLFIAIVNSNLMDLENKTLLMKLIKPIFKKMWAELDGYLPVVLSFWDSKLFDLKRICDEDHNQKKHSDLIRDCFKSTSYSYHGFTGIKRLGKILDSKGQELQGDGPVVSTPLLRLKADIYKLARLEFDDMLKSSSLEYQGKASNAIYFAACAFQTPNYRTIELMLSAARALGKSRSHLGSWLLIAGGFLVMALGYAASANTLGISAYIGQEWGMKLILLGAGSLAAGAATRGYFQFFNSNLESTIEESAPELRIPQVYR